MVIDAKFERDKFERMPTTELAALVDNGVDAAISPEAPKAPDVQKYLFLITVVGDGPLTGVGERPGFYYYLFPTIDSKVRDHEFYDGTFRIQVNSRAYYMDRTAEINGESPIHKFFENKNIETECDYPVKEGDEYSPASTDLVILDYSHFKDPIKFMTKYRAAGVLFSRFAEEMTLFFVVGDEIKNKEYCFGEKDIYSVSESSHLGKGRLGKDISCLMEERARNGK